MDRPASNFNFVDRISNPSNFIANETNRFDERVTDLTDQLRFGAADMGSLQSAIDELRADMVTTFSAIREQSRVNWVDVFRFANHLGTLEQRIKTPYAYAKKGRHNLRKQIVNGSYGVNAYIVDTALQLYEQNLNDPVQTAQLRGVINDQTPIALINRKETPSESAFSASISDDHLYKNDFDYWRITRDQTRRYNIQSKSSRHSIEEQPDTTEPIYYIYADMFHNRVTDDGVTFPVSRLIVQEVEGTISDEGKTYLDDVHASFINQLHELVDEE